MKKVKELIVNILDTLSVVIAGLTWFGVVGLYVQI